MKIYIPFCLLVSVIFYFTTLILGNVFRDFYHKNTDKEDSFLSPSMKKLCFLEVIACVIIYRFNIGYGTFAKFPKKIVLFNGVIFFIFFIFTSYIILQIIRVSKHDLLLSAKLKEYEVLQDYTLKIESLYSDLRTFKHDYVNILSSMNLMIENKEYEQLETYFQQKILPLSQTLSDSNDIFVRLVNLKILELKGILFAKLLFATNCDIDLTIDIPFPVESININLLDLTRIIGVFLDNAIEEAQQQATDNRFLYVGLLQSREKIIIRIQNSSRAPEHLKTIMLPGVSTKSADRGFGLYSVSKLLSQYDNIILNTNYHEYKFTQQLDIFF